MAPVPGYFTDVQRVVENADGLLRRPVNCSPRPSHNAAATRGSRWGDTLRIEHMDDSLGRVACVVQLEDPPHDGRFLGIYDAPVSGNLMMLVVHWFAAVSVCTTASTQSPAHLTCHSPSSLVPKVFQERLVLPAHHRC